MDDSERTRAKMEANREGQAANDNNRRVYRTHKGALLENPYPAGSEKFKGWNEGYQYRDMVNDG